MIELPEALNLAKQLQSGLVNRKVSAVLPPTKRHKYCFFSKEPTLYQDDLLNAKVVDAEGFGIFVDLVFDNGLRLSINDGIHCRLHIDSQPEEYQLLIQFDGGRNLAFTVGMYGSLLLHDDNFDNTYYKASRSAVSLFKDEMTDHFFNTLAASSQSLSAKAFLATEQRFPGIGNGMIQDILYEAGIHPKRKVMALSESEKRNLLNAVQRVAADMINLGGRNTEKDIYGMPGLYSSKMSKNTVGKPCDICSTLIMKESYMGGSVYYCPNCQKL